jgi:hypothetical protein
MTPDKNSLAYRLRFPGPDDPQRVTSPAATDRLTLFNARRLNWLGATVDECVLHADMHEGTPQQQAIHCFLEIRAVVGEGIGYA